jgi:leucyl/phenylalanyl-tRNA--protein transferase
MVQLVTSRLVGCFFDGRRSRLPIFRIPTRHIFPDPEQAEPNGLLGVGGDLDPRRLVLAYGMGIFPWYSEGEPILWFSPDPRMIFEPGSVHVSRSLGKRLRRGDYDVSMDQGFEAVIQACAGIPRPGQPGTWITRDMLDAYTQLHQLGLAHSVEVWRGDELVGGLYGVSIGGMFAGESMFSTAPDASKVAMVALSRQLQRWGFTLMDAQFHTEHLARMGGFEVPRSDYLARLEAALAMPTRQEPWQLDQP